MIMNLLRLLIILKAYIKVYCFWMELELSWFKCPYTFADRVKK